MFRPGTHDTFQVTVGDPTSRQKAFSLETRLFTKRSGYLAQCIADKPQEQIFLLETNPEVFEVYIQCVRIGAHKIKTWSNSFELGTQRGSREIQEAADAVFKLLIDLYLLAGVRLWDDRTAHLAIDEIVRFSHDFDVIPESSVDWAYENTEKDDRLRWLMRDFWIYETALAGSKRLLNEPFLHDDAMHDIAIGLLPHIEHISGFEDTVKENVDGDKCYYHDHENTGRCDNMSSSSGDSCELRT